MMSSSGSMTSPLPETMNEFFASATHSSASRRRRLRSVRQSFASSIAARVRLPYCCSFASKRSNSVNASAVPPANPASTLPSYSRRTLRALAFITVLPSDTWPSPPTATTPLRRTERIVVPCSSVMSGLASRAGMGCVVDLGEVLEIKVRIDLRRRDIRVAEQFLHSRAGPGSIRADGVANEWRNMCGWTWRPRSLPLRPAFDALLHDARPDTTPAPADEQCLSLPASPVPTAP